MSGGSFDFSSALAIDVDFNFTDNLMMTAVIRDSLTASAVTKSTTGGDLQFLLSDFSSSIDTTDIRSMAFVAGGSYFSDFGGSFALDKIALSDPSAVPEPAAIWLFGTGILGLIGFSKRRKAA